MNYLSVLRKKVNSPEIVDVLTQDMMWQRHDVAIWQAERFEGIPTFYPVYNYENYYSYSLLALIVKKQSLAINEKAYNYASSQNFEILPNETLIDREIRRISGPTRFGNEISDTSQYCLKIVEAIKKDIALIEKANPGYTNVIMCGGKDSLNMLLLPWENPVIVYSAEPNFPLVQQFVKDNNLSYEVKELKDPYDEEHLADEVAELCCRVDSRNWRWAKHISQISEQYSRKIVIWKGQMGDVFFSTNWKTYIYPEKQPKLFLCKIFKKFSSFMPGFLVEKLGKIIIKDVEQTHWIKGSVAQGAHMGFIRALANCLVLSIYHGKNVMEVLSTVSLPETVNTDIRNEIGTILFKKRVFYPSANPSPKLIENRAGAHCPDKFIRLLKKNGIEIKP